MYHVLVPIDQDEERAAAQADAVARLPDGASSVHATVLHVADPDAEGPPTDPAEMPAGERVLDRLSESDATVETERRSGDPATTIIQMATEVGADMIVLGGRKRSPLGTLLFGSVSQSVLLDADRPVTVTGAEIKEDPSHRCENCGETYYTEPDMQIDTCRSCGGVHVEQVA